MAGYTPDQVMGVAALVVGTFILLLFYFVGTWSILGGSPGQLVMSLHMVDKSARGIGFGKALMRFIWKSILLPLAPVSGLLVALGKEKRAPHDLLASTYVIQFLDADVAAARAAVKAVEAPAPVTTAPAAPTAGAILPRRHPTRARPRGQPRRRLRRPRRPRCRLQTRYP